MRIAIATVLVAMIGLGSIAGMQARIDDAREDSFDQDLLYLPNRALLTHFTGGLNVVLADVLWLQCIQYTAEHFHGDGKFRWLAHMGDVITDLDPYFVGAYRYIGMFLAALEANDEASLKLLHKGMRNNPEEWRLPYEAAMVYLLNRRDEEGSPEMAARYLSYAITLGTAPPELANVAQGLARRHNFDDIEREMWTETLASNTDPLMRELAERKLILMNCRDTVAQLQQSVDGYREQFGEYPDSLETLFTAAGQQPPPLTDDLGGRYFLGPEGEVMNTSMLDESLDLRTRSLRSKVRVFDREVGRFPRSFEEIVQEKFMAQVPAHPYPGGEWNYDPATGEITSNLPEEFRSAP